MRIFVPALLLISAIACAQESPLKGPATGDPTANSSTPGTYQGCVIRSGGKTMLTDAANRDYQLVSSAGSLDSYVGQEVHVTAYSINPGDPSSDEHGFDTGQPQGQPTTLDVRDIQKISDRCTSPQSTDKK